MSNPVKVIAVCNYAVGFHMLAEKLRENYPDAEILVVIRRGEQLTDKERKFIDGVLESSAPTLSAVGGLLGLMRLAIEIRTLHAEEVALQYESLKLRLFGLACRPRRCRAWLGNGQRLEIPLSVGANVIDLLQHRAHGYGVVLAAVWHAYVIGAINEPPERPRR